MHTSYEKGSKDNNEEIIRYIGISGINKVELGKVKKDMPFSAIFTLLDFFLCYNMQKLPLILYEFYYKTFIQHKCLFR